MLYNIKVGLLILFTSIFCASASTGVEPDKVKQLEIRSLKVINVSQFSGGQPTLEQLDGLRRVGVKHIVNLRTSDEQEFDESVLVNELNLGYFSIPVSGKSAINEINANKLAGVLKEIGNDPVYVHCASGNRVGALIAINEFKVNGGDIDAAITKGKQWGLTRLEKTVKAKLEKIKAERSKE